jgi:two-component system chemotaxis response regulator CheY
MARLLVADDAEIVRRLVVEMLAAGGHEVVGEAASGEETLRVYEEVSPDVAIIDVNMPGGDGLSAAAEIRRRHPRARIVIAAALVTPKRLIQADGVGAAEYVVKPFEQRQLLDAVDAALAQ